MQNLGSIRCLEGKSRISQNKAPKSCHFSPLICSSSHAAPKAYLHVCVAQSVVPRGEELLAAATEARTWGRGMHSGYHAGL